MQQKLVALGAHKTFGVAISMSRASLAAVRRALAGHYPVKAAIEVQAESGGEREDYGVDVRLTWR